LNISDIIDLEKYPINDPAFQQKCSETIEQTGALLLQHFVHQEIVMQVRDEGLANQKNAFYCTQQHNVYLQPADNNYPPAHPRNRHIESSKGCITDDQIPLQSPLHVLYDSDDFQHFLCQILGEKRLYDYADPLSSINLHYAKTGQQLGWHFDNSSFATTLMIQEPESGGQFEYVQNTRNADAGEMNFTAVAKVLDGQLGPKQLTVESGTLVIFRGRDTIHRVTPVQGNRTRMLVVFAYNLEPDKSLSEDARLTFYGRIR